MNSAPQYPRNDLLTEAVREMALAEKNPIAQLKTLKRMAARLAIPIRHGLIKQAHVVDRLTEQANNIGLSAATTQQTVENAIADGFADGFNNIFPDTTGAPEPHERGQQNGTPQEPAPQQANSLRSARASTFQPRAVQWIWPGRFAIGKLGIIAGLPDEGKGQIFCDIAARITRGELWPCHEGHAPQGNVILATAEDDISDTVVPRLLAAGADLTRIEIVRMVREENRDRMFSLISDLDLLRDKILKVGDVRMVQIDPISAYLGVRKIDSFRTTDVRAVLSPITEFANELKVSVLGIMHFNKKTDVTNALLRISDSLAFGATARHVYAVVDDAQNKRKLFVKAKNNLAPPDTKALAYGFGAREVGVDPETKTEIWAPHIVWHPQHVDVTATEAMQAASENKSPIARDNAKKFLTDLLAEGPVKKSDIEEAAEANCISGATLRRAKDELGIIAKKDGLTGPWMWQLPANEPPPPSWEKD
jgi:hypothetical protein